MCLAVAVAYSHRLTTQPAGVMQPSWRDWKPQKLFSRVPGLSVPQRPFSQISDKIPTTVTLQKA
jgi:hypothetical protein